jgi:hypothetical protein
MQLIRAVTHIRLTDANTGKLAQLDALAEEYMRLCQQYTTAFCTAVAPDKYADAWLSSPLSARWQRVVIQHAAAIARSWRANRDRAYAAYLDDLADDQELARASLRDPKRRAPTWREWHTPRLKQTLIQANANVVVLEPSQHSSFDFWLKISTLEKGKPQGQIARLSQEEGPAAPAVAHQPALEPPCPAGDQSRGQPVLRRSRWHADRL